MATAAPSPGPPAPPATGSFEITYVATLEPKDNRDVWELVRGLSATFQFKPLGQSLVLPDQPRPVGYANLNGLLQLRNEAGLLADPGGFDRFCRAHGLTEVRTHLSADQLDSAPGRAVLALGYESLGLSYAEDRLVVRKRFPPASDPTSDSLLGWALKPMESTPARFEEALSRPYDALSEDLRREIDEALLGKDTKFGFFLKRRGSAEPALAGVTGKFLRQASYGTGLYVSKFWTSEAVRGKGYGRVLMDNVVRLALEQRVDVISLHSSEGLSYPFYDRYGFRRAHTVTGAYTCEGGRNLDAFEYVLERARFPATLTLAP